LRRLESLKVASPTADSGSRMEGGEQGPRVQLSMLLAALVGAPGLGSVPSAPSSIPTASLERPWTEESWARVAARLLPSPLAERVISSELQSPTTTEGFASYEKQPRPSYFLRTQFLDDDAGFQRWKTLAGVTFSSCCDSTLDVAAESSHYEDETGDRASREAVVGRYAWQSDPTWRFECDGEAGATAGGDTSVGGGLFAAVTPLARTEASLRYRHDDFIDPGSPFDFHRKNSAFSVRLLEGDLLEADSVGARVAREESCGLGILADAAGSWIEDGNSRFESYLEVHWRAYERETVRVVPRVFHSEDDFQDASAQYFSPSGLRSLGAGLRTEVNKPETTAFGDAALFHQPGDVDAVGWELAAGVRRQLRENVVAGLTASFFDSAERGDGRYRAFAALLTFTAGF
jgi:hypothetical protein